MSTAILISGQMRTFAQCFPTQYWQVYRHYPDCHFFIVAQNNEQSKSVEVLKERYPETHIHAKFIDDPTDLPEILQELGRHAPYANAAPHRQLMLQHWYQWQVWEYFKSWKESCPVEDSLDNDFETFIRMRPDNRMQQFSPVFCGESMIEQILAYHSSAQGGASATCFSPWWGKFGGMNDRMAIMGSKSAPTYFTLYNSIPQLLKDGCPFHPESLLLAHLEKNGAKVNHTLNAMFGTLRLPQKDAQGQWRQEMRFPEIQAHEIAEYARHK